MTSLEETKSCRWRVPFHLRMVLASIATGQKHHSFSGLGTAWATLSRLNPARLLYVGRWSFDLISSEILPFLLITNCFTLNTQQHKISPQSSGHPPLSPSTSVFQPVTSFYYLFLFYLSPSSLLQPHPTSRVHCVDETCVCVCVCTADRQTEW